MEKKIVVVLFQPSLYTYFILTYIPSLFSLFSYDAVPIQFFQFEFQFQYNFREKYSVLFEMDKIVFKLLILSAFCPFFVETVFKFPWKSRSSTSLTGSSNDQVVPRAFSGSISPGISQPSTSQMMDLRQRRPLHSTLSSSTNSMKTIDLNSRASSRSSPNLNTMNSPAIMQEMTNMHRQAAVVLNSERINLMHSSQQQNRFQQIGSIARDSGIGIAALGGIITVVNTFSTDDIECGKNVSCMNIIKPTTTTIKKIPDIKTPIGKDM